MWGQAIRRALESLRLGHEADALDLTEKAIGLALDTDPALALRLTPEGLVTYLGIGGAVDSRRAQMLADALEARSRVLLAMGRDEEADLDMARADAVRDAGGISTSMLDDIGVTGSPNPEDSADDSGHRP